MLLNAVMLVGLQLWQVRPVLAFTAPYFVDLIDVELIFYSYICDKQEDPPKLCMLGFNLINR